MDMMEKTPDNAIFHDDPYATPRILIAEDAIRNAVAKTATEIESRVFPMLGGQIPLIVCVMDGAMVFMTDLVRRLAFPMEWAFVKASSYGDNTRSNGNVALNWISPPSFENRPVLIIDDILDTGHTMKTLMDTIRAHHPKRLLSCVLLRKTIPSDSERIEPDFHCFDIPDVFVVGYGLDLAGRYRNLPYIGVIEQ